MKKKSDNFHWMQSFKRKELEKQGRTEVSREGYYNTRSWKNLRLAHLIENPLCVMCMDKGYYVPATVVDHINPVSVTDMEAFLDPTNIQSLCVSCHCKKTNNDRAGKKTLTKDQSRKLMDDDSQ